MTNFGIKVYVNGVGTKMSNFLIFIRGLKSGGEIKTEKMLIDSPKCI